MAAHRTSAAAGGASGQASRSSGAGSVAIRWGDLDRRRPRACLSARERLERDRAERVDVDLGADLATFELLGSHVRRRPEHRPRARRVGRALRGERDPEVGELRPPALPEQDVRRLDVAVHYPCACA